MKYRSSDERILRYTNRWGVAEMDRTCTWHLVEGESFVAGTLNHLVTVSGISPGHPIYGDGIHALIGAYKDNKPFMCPHEFEILVEDDNEPIPGRVY